jgi:hypoxanthine phosphoribosyltransferase
MTGLAEDEVRRRGGISPDTLASRTDIILKETTFDGTTYVCPTWEQMRQFNLDLVKKITASGQSFDRVIALSRGGLTWSRTLADALRVPEISTIRIKTYSGINQVGEPQITQPLTDIVRGETVLIFDEVAETGITLEIAKSHVKKKRAKKISTATLCYKPYSKVKPDFYAFQTSAWVIFPHEIRETVDELSAKWAKPTDGRASLSIEEIKERFLAIGLPADEVEFYLSNL